MSLKWYGFNFFHYYFVCYFADVVGVVSDVHSKPTDDGIAVKVTLGDQRCVIAIMILNFEVCLLFFLSLLW
jgi:hypothetical protein